MEIDQDTRQAEQLRATIKNMAKEMKVVSAELEASQKELLEARNRCLRLEKKLDLTNFQTPTPYAPPTRSEHPADSDEIDRMFSELAKESMRAITIRHPALGTLLDTGTDDTGTDDTGVLPRNNSSDKKSLWGWMKWMFS